MQRQHQLTLEMRLRDEATFDNFLVRGDNSGIIDALKRLGLPGGEPVVFLHGAAGCGKTHLLQASCHRIGSRSLYLPLAELVQYAPEEVLHGVESLDLVCLDDIQVVLGKPGWETALFNLYNRARQRGCALQFAGDAAPRNLDIVLPDLRSRLSWGVVFKMGQADDEQKADILCFRAARRGLALSPEVASYIVHRAPRGMEALLNVLDQLDNESLAEQRLLSIPFVKSTLGW